MTALNKAGGIIILISLFLPTILIIADVVSITIWMFGLMYWTGYITRVWFFPDIIGIALFIVILVFSILCITKDPGETRVFGILSIVFIIIHYLFWLIFFAGIMILWGTPIIAVIPFIGLFGILIGAILNIAAS